MLTASYLGNRQIAIRSAEPEPPAPGQVQVEVAYTGICGTDLHVLHGEMDERVSAPAILGHEMSGVLAALGDGVTGWAVGDHVTVVPLTWDGTCPACRAGHRARLSSPAGQRGRLCRAPCSASGTSAPTSWSRFPPSCVWTTPRSSSPPRSRCTTSGARDLAPGDRVVVLGGGPIGVLIAAVARHEGADVVVVEVDPQRRAYVEALGFDVGRSRSPSTWRRGWTTGRAARGRTSCSRCPGRPPPHSRVTDLVRVRGTIVIVGIHPGPRPFDLHRIFLRELRVVGARVYERSDFERAVELLAARGDPGRAG